MNKSNLKNGMHVKLRGGSIREYYKGYFIGVEYNELGYIDFYDIDLKHNTESELDIMEVFDEDNNTIWEREKEVDWSKVPVDTKVLVSDGGKYWYKRYFMKYGDGMYYTFPDGLTSWSANEEDGVIKWKYYKLAEKPKEEEVTFYDIEKEMNQYCHDQNEDRICQQECDTCGMKYILANYNLTRKDNK